jgi:hypothetical protein
MFISDVLIPPDRVQTKHHRQCGKSLNNSSLVGGGVVMQTDLEPPDTSAVSSRTKEEIQIFQDTLLYTLKFSMIQVSRIPM